MGKRSAAGEPDRRRLRFSSALSRLPEGDVFRPGRSSRVVFTLALLTAAGVLSGCATRRFQPGRSRPPEELPRAIVERYAYPKGRFELTPCRELESGESPQPEWNTPFRCTVRAVSDHESYVLNEVQIFAGATVVRFDYYMVKSDGRRPAVLVFPIFGGSYGFAKMFADHFARNGLCCALMYRKEALVEAETFAELEPPLRQVVIDSKIAVDWLCDRAEIDPIRVGSFGISMGGIKSATIKCLEPRIGPAVVALAGGSLAEILASSREPKIVERKEILIGKEGVSGAEFQSRADAAILTDPMKLAHYADPSEIKMFIALFDKTVPTRLQLKLWRGFGRPELSILPLGHYTAALAIPYARWQSLRFFERKFGVRRPPRRSTAP